MQRLATILFLSILTGLCARAQDACHYGSGDAAENLIKLLSSEKSCKAAAAKLHECQWGSSADTQFAPIVIHKCEATFYKQLSTVGKTNYGQEMQLCAYENARQTGTLAMSEAAMCQVDTAAEFGAHPSLKDHPPARASFDCATAQSSMEKAICSDRGLGHADIVLSRVYSNALKNATPKDKARVMANERRWLRALTGTCKLSASPFTNASLDCLRNQFEIRFTTLDDCIDASTDSPISECLASPSEDGDQAAGAAMDSPQRASFDCEKPSTSMDIAICADAELGQTDIKLAQAYQDAGVTMTLEQHKDLVDSERQWLLYVNQTCPIGVIGGIPSVMARSCIRTAFETRIDQLRSCSRKNTPEELPCLDDFTLFLKK
jgi:uncharacterized protein